MAKFDNDWITFENEVRLKRSNIVGYHRNKGENFTKVITVNDTFAANETPDEIDFLLGKTISTNEGKK